jgi:predicted acetylornithine/succinylornithine family transaminase
MGSSERIDAGQVMADYEAAVQYTYGRTPVVMVRGEGAQLWDSEGQRYVDWVSGGRAGTALGHCHPDVVHALKAQLETLLFVSNDFYHPWAGRLGRMLADRSGGRKAFFCNSGTEASEAALKLARKWSQQTHGPGRHVIVTAAGSFHGRTLGALSATGQTKFQEAFKPVVPGFRYVPFNDAAALAAALTPDVCAVYLEPVQGESGIYPAHRDYLPAVERLCRERGALFMLDEVQTGFGRTGRFWAYEHYGIEPDVVTTAKALGGGLPVGACLAKPEVCALAPGDHGSTFGGNPFCAVAALAALEALERHGYVENAAAQGERLLAGLRALQQQHAAIKEVRGLGLMVGVEFHGGEGKAVVAGSLERGLLVHPVGDGIVRILPPVCIAAAEIDEGLQRFGDAVAAAC